MITTGRTDWWLHCNLFDFHRSDYLPDLITNRTLDLIEDMKDRSAPFMAVLGFPAPHGPEDAAPQYQDLFQNVTTHHTPAYNLAPNPDKQWILRHTEEMLPVHKVSACWFQIGS